MRLLRSPALLLAVWLAGVGCLRAETPEPPVIQAKGDTAIQADDEATLTRLTTDPGKSVWLIRLSKARYITPPARSCEVYLRPEVQSERLRRGELRRGLGYDEPDGRTRWELAERPHAYALVSLPGQPFESEKTPLVASDGPFVVRGTVSDQDLVEAVDLVRKNDPSQEPPASKVTRTENADGSIGEFIEPAGPGGARIDHGLPVSSVEAKDADHLEIMTSTGEGSGQQIKLQREDRHWKITEVWQWVA